MAQAPTVRGPARQAGPPVQVVDKPLAFNPAHAVAPTQVMRSITYAPLPWDTHPIDTVPTQQMGWGPFWGPWQQVDFADPAASIDIGYTGSNATSYSPPYAGITVFKDPSTSLVANRGFLPSVAAALGLDNGSGASTIRAAGGPPTSSRTNPFARVLAAVGMNRG